VSKLHRILLAGAMVALASSTSQAGTLGPGGLVGSAISVTTLDTSDLSTATTFTTDYAFFGGVDSLAGVSGIASGVTLDLSTPGSFVIQVGDFKFYNAVVTDTSSDTTPTGTKVRSFTLTGWADLGTSPVDTNTSTLIISFNQAQGAPISSSISIAVPAVIPEPSSVALAGIGLAAAGLFGLRKRVAK